MPLGTKNLIYFQYKQTELQKEIARLQTIIEEDKAFISRLQHTIEDWRNRFDQLQQEKDATEHARERLFRELEIMKVQLSQVRHISRVLNRLGCFLMP